MPEDEDDEEDPPYSLGWTRVPFLRTHSDTSELPRSGPKPPLW